MISALKFLHAIVMLPILAILVVIVYMAGGAVGWGASAMAFPIYFWRKTAFCDTSHL